MSDSAKSDPRRQLGAIGEDAAAAWYVARGFEIVDRNWRVREGEIDLIMRREATIVFCEVKTRSSDRFGTPVEAVTATKQRRLRALGAKWLAQNPTRRGETARGEVRFDVASVTPGGASPAVEVVEAAF
jgi:putative endonuclease